MPICSFTVTRTGDITAASSVDWTLEGSLQPADLVAGQASGGRVSWLANETNNKSVDIYVKGNTTPEPDKTVSVRLGNPVNAIITGNALATMTIKDDDTVVVNPGSILPTWRDQYTSSDVRTVTNGTELQAAIDNVNDLGTIILNAPVDYGIRDFDQPKRYRIISNFPPFTGGDWSKFHDLSLEMQNHNDMRVADLRVFRPGVGTIATLANTAKLAGRIFGSQGDLYIQGVRILPENRIEPTGGTGHRWWLDTFRHDDHEGAQLRGDGNQRGSVTQVVISRGFMWTDGDRADPTGPNMYCDYGFSGFQAQSYIFEDILYFGTNNHTIAVKAGCLDTRVNRFIHMRWGTRPGNIAGSQFPMFDYGQQGEPDGGGDNTAGKLTLTESTFSGQYPNGDTQGNELAVLQLCNATGASVTGCYFWEHMDNLVHAQHADEGGNYTSGNNPPRIAWSAGLDFNNNEIWGTAGFSLESTPSGYTRLAIRAANNIVHNTAGMIPVSGRANATWTLGANSGFQ